MSSFLSLLPPALRNDETVIKLSAILDSEIATIDKLIRKILVYGNLKNHSEDIIDELAKSFHMLGNEGYRFADTIDKKRELAKSAITLHRHKGTLYAVKEVLRILGIDGKVLEWFEYGGAPYHFKIEANINGGISEKDLTILETLLNEFKNVRSHLESVTFKIISKSHCRYAVGGQSGEIITIRPYALKEINANHRFFYGFGNTINECIEIRPNIQKEININHALFYGLANTIDELVEIKPRR